MLECGVGTGFPFALEFAKDGWQVTGVDIAENLLKQCKDNASVAGVTISCVRGDIERLSIAYEVFDLVYCFQCSWHFPNVKTAIDEMIRVTRPGGYIIFDVMNILSPKIALQHVKAVLYYLLRVTWRIVRRRSLVDLIIHETPTLPATVSMTLRRHRVKWVMTTPRTNHCDRPEDVSLFVPRLVYICRKDGHQ